MTSILEHSSSTARAADVNDRLGVLAGDGGDPRLQQFAVAEGVSLLAAYLAIPDPEMRSWIRHLVEGVAFPNPPSQRRSGG